MSYVAVAIGTVSALGQIQQGKTDRAMAGLQAQELNYQGEQEKAASLEQAQLIRKAARFATSSADAGFAASGVQVGSGSAAEVDRQIAIDSEHDAYQTILSGTKKANALRAQGAGVNAQGLLAEANANQKAASTVLASGYQGMVNSGWRTAGPGYSGLQAPAPIVTAQPSTINK